MDDQDMLNLANAAKELGVGRNTIMRYGEKGLIEIVRRPFGRFRYFVARAEISRLKASAQPISSKPQRAKRKGK